MGSSFHKSLTGQDLHAPSRYLVDNTSGVTIPALSYVKLVSTNAGNVPTVTVCSSISDNVFGIIETAVLPGATGYVTSNGILLNVNTAAWPIGTLLYCSATGTLTNLDTSYANRSIVLKSNATTGTLFVQTAASSTDADNVYYTLPFTVGDWIGPSAGFYTIPFTHNLGETLVETDVWDASNAPVDCERMLTSNNIVTLRVPSSPDLRFDGLVWIKKT